jgi:UDP-glucuronate 4-epimerase
MKILVTGAAGFIGFHLVTTLLKEGHLVIGIDNINDYYDPKLKYARLSETGIVKQNVLDNSSVQSEIYPNYRFLRMDLSQKEDLMHLFSKERFDVVVNLAAQAGVRYSIENPDVYIKSNVQGFLNILEACRNYPVKHLVYASSSSVYGSNKKVPFSVEDSVDHPVSLYAATKKSNELMAYTYSHLFNIPTTGLRFFTVYGPWGRPDMAPSLFADAILHNRPINVFNNGEMERDFTYVDDIVQGIIGICEKPPKIKNNNPPYVLHNVGNNKPIKLMDFIASLEKHFNIQATKNYMPMQAGDVKKTFADISSLQKEINYQPQTILDDGVKAFADWYKSYHTN